MEPEVSNAIHMIEPWATTALTALTNLGQIEHSVNPVFTMQEEAPEKWETTVTGPKAAGDLDPVVANADFIVGGMVGEIPRTGEKIAVTSRAGTTLTVRRGVGTTPAAAIVSGDRIAFIGEALEEGQDNLDPRVRGTGSHDGYCQLFERVMGVTDIAELAGYRGPNERTRVNTNGVMEFKKGQNRAIVHGEPAIESSGPANSLPVYYSAGLRYYCSLYNQVNLGPTLTLAGLQNGLMFGTAHTNANVVTALTSERMWALLSQMPDFKDTIRTSQDNDTLGAVCSHIRFPGGRANILIDNSLVGQYWDTEFLVFQWSNFVLKEFQPLSAQEVDVQGASRSEWQYLRRVGLGCRQPIACSRLYLSR